MPLRDVLNLSHDDETSRWIRLLEYFIPHRERFASFDEWRKARIIAALCLSLALFTTAALPVFHIFTQETFAFPVTEDYLMVFVIFTYAIALIINASTQKVLYASLSLLFGITTVIIGFIVQSGGPYSYTGFFYSMLPLLALILLGFRGSIAMILLLVLIQVTVYLTYPQDPTKYAAPGMPKLRYIVYMQNAFIVTMWVIGCMLEQSRIKANDALEASHGELIKAMISRNEAEQASRAKSQFLANMSHELRTPLNAIIGYTELIQEDTEEKGQSYYEDELGRIKGAGQHLLALINDVLDLSKIEAGEMSLSQEELDLSQLLNEIIGTTRILAKNSRNEVICKLPQQLPHLRTDAKRLRQILLNLLSNAAKFTSDGTITLHVETFTNGPGQSWMRYTVQDTGIGMDEEQQKNIFQKFTQLDSSYARRYSGTGLGLAIAREFCQLMGGHIHVESKVGQGSTFTVELPTTPLQASTIEHNANSFSTPLRVT